MKKFPLFGALVGVLVLGVASYFFVYAFFVYAPNTISEQEGVWVEIPELNIKLWMPADKSDLVYSAVVSDGAFGSVVLLSSASLMEAQKMAESGEYLEYCTPAHSPLGRILPFTAGTIEGPVTSLSPSYLGPQAACSGDDAVNDVQSSYLAILRDSVKTAERIHPPERVLDTTPEWNVLRETRTPTLFRTWTHDNGTAVSLSLKDYVYLIGDGGRIIGSFQTLLTVTKPGGGELVLWNSEPRNPYFGSDNIKDAEFSPLGSYFSYSSPGYEAYDTGTYDVRTGSAKIASRAIERGPGWPYWSPDEKRLAYLRWSSPIEGQVAEIMWSPTGSPENLRTVRRFDGPGSLDNAYFENVRHSGSLVTFEIQEGEGQVLDDKTGEVKTYGGRGEKFSFDLESGILSTLGTF